MPGVPGDRAPASRRRHKLERIDVARPDHTEVPMVQRRDTTRPEPLSDHDEAGVGFTKSEVGVALDEFGDALVVGCGEHLDQQVAGGDRPAEARLGLGPELALVQVAGLSDDERARDERLSSRPSRRTLGGPSRCRPPLPATRPCRR